MGRGPAPSKKRFTYGTEPAPAEAPAAEETKATTTEKKSKGKK